MLPRTKDMLANDFEYSELPSKTYQLHPDKNQIAGFTDGLEAVKQAMYLILNTERYKHLIYSWNYGIELDNLIGKPIPFVMADLERRISETLTQDDRIIAVSGFECEAQKGKVRCTFQVETIYGEIEERMEVNV